MREQEEKVVGEKRGGRVEKGAIALCMLKDVE